MSYEVRLEVFEGPLDLLMHLIKKNEINIYDIPISLITQQYLHYVELMKNLNLDLAGEFLVMAATLTQIKSRMLLPKEESPEGQEEEEEDPRAELVRRLLEYQRFKDAAESLEDREDQWRDIFRRQPPQETHPEPEDLSQPLPLEVGLFDLIDALQKVLERLPSKKVLEFQADEFSMKDKIALILEHIEKENGLDFTSLFVNAASRRAVIVTFLALLELVKMGLVKVIQPESVGPIQIFRAACEEGSAEGAGIEN
ncbi:MAG: segregation/condensation protein A [Nitrospirae bacterium]|nr:segregation/condensation protein A [Nitrospirota bacterium]